jgi:small subunit ribosomal protein S18
MARPRTRRRDDRVERKPKKRVSILDSEQITYVDYKDVNLLRRFMSERAKIRARRVTGNDTQQQREIARAIRVAREMALLPYSVRQVTHRSKGRRGERGERERELGANEVGAEVPRGEVADELDVLVEADELGAAEGTQNGDDALITGGPDDDGPDDDGPGAGAPGAGVEDDE